MQQTIPLSRIVERWAEALANDEALTKFCNDKYGKPAQLYVGYDDVDAPLENDCPCIILLPSNKSEGLADTYTYSLMIVGVLSMKAQLVLRILFDTMER
mgnify:CR=1 FL=1